MKICVLYFFFKQKTAYEMRISDWSSDVCSSDLLDGLDDLELLARAGRAGDHVHAAVAQAQRLQDVEADLHLLHRIGGERHAYGVADAGPKQVAHADRTLDGAAPGAAVLGDAAVPRVVAGSGPSGIGSHHAATDGELAGHLEIE